VAHLPRYGPQVATEAHRGDQPREELPAHASAASAGIDFTIGTRGIGLTIPRRRLDWQHMAPMERYNIFDYDGIVAVAFKNTPKVNEALLNGGFKETHEAIKAFVQKYKQMQLDKIMPAVLAVICFEPPPLRLPGGTRLCDRCYKPLPALAHGRRKRHSSCQ
jgi:hypothetical protein